MYVLQQTNDDGDYLIIVSFPPLLQEQLELSF